MGRLQSVQILRFAAAFAVVLLHANEVAFPLGAAGVDVFFVISGFIISRIGARENVGQFVAGRLRRIYPIYWICSVPSVWIYFHAGNLDTGRLITTITLWPVLGGYSVPYLWQAWTLSFEMLFYSCAALVIWRPDWARVFLVAYAGAFALAMTTGFPLFGYVGNPLIAEFLLGVLVAHSKPVGRDIGATLLLLAVIWFAFTYFFAADYMKAEDVFALTRPLRPLVWGLPSALLLWGALQFEPKGSFAGLFAYLGDASYSIYLVHKPLILFLLMLMPWPLAVVAVLALGVFVHRYVEQPLLKLMKRKRPILRPTPAA